MTIVYTNIGRSNGCKTMEIEITVNSVKEVIETKVAKGAREFLVSDDVSAVEYKKNKFNIYAGFRIVGTAEII